MINCGRFASSINSITTEDAQEIGLEVVVMRIGKAQPELVSNATKFTARDSVLQENNLTIAPFNGQGCSIARSRYERFKAPARSLLAISIYRS